MNITKLITDLEKLVTDATPLVADLEAVFADFQNAPTSSEAVDYQANGEIIAALLAMLQNLASNPALQQIIISIITAFLAKK